MSQGRKESAYRRIGIPAEYKPHSTELSNTEIDMELTKYFARIRLLPGKTSKSLRNDTDYGISTYQKADCGKEVKFKSNFQRSYSQQERMKAEQF